MMAFVQAKNANNQQFSVLLNYVLPKYEETCLSVYCNNMTEGKLIFNDQSDEKLADFVDQYVRTQVIQKNMIGEQ